MRRSHPAAPPELPTLTPVEFQLFPHHPAASAIKKRDWLSARDVLINAELMDVFFPAWLLDGC